MKKGVFAGIIVITVALIAGFIIFQNVREGNNREDHSDDVSYRIENNTIILSWGEKPTGGYSIDIEDIVIDEKGDLSVYYSLTSPAPGENVTQSITYPEDSAEIPTGEYEKIHLKLMK